MSNNEQIIKNYENNSKNIGQGEERINSKILPIRDINNWAKAVLINKAKILTQNQQGIKVLDLCCGKGGDLSKFRCIENIKYYSGVDITLQSLVQAIGRYNSYLQYQQSHRKQAFEADFILCDVGNYPLYKHISNQIQYDIVSCMLALHYMFQSEQKALTFFKNVDQLISKNGRFIALFPSKDTLKSRFKNQQDKLRISSPIMNIQFKNPIQEDQHLFGEAYSFSLAEALSDTEEYLVDLQCLKNVLKKSNLEIEYQFGSIEDMLTSDEMQGTSRESLLKRLTKNTYQFIQLLKQNNLQINEKNLELIDQQLNNQENNNKQGISSFDQIPQEYLDVIRIYMCVIIKHKDSQQTIQSIKKQQEFKPHYIRISDICNLSDKQIDYDQIKYQGLSSLPQPYYYQESNNN